MIDPPLAITLLVCLLATAIGFVLLTRALRKRTAAVAAAQAELAAAGQEIATLRRQCAEFPSVQRQAARVPELEARAAQVDEVGGKAEWANGWLEATCDEIEHLATKRLPALVNAEARGHRGIVVPGPLADDFQDLPVEKHHQAVLDLCREAVAITRERIGGSARSALREVLGEAQTYMVRCQNEILETIERAPEGAEQLQWLFDFDHLVTRAVHAVQRVLILSGSWPGVQRDDCTMSDVISSARGRIEAPARVVYTHEATTGEAWVEGRVVEAVTVALTELLANASAYTQGKVDVQVQQVQTGYCIVVDDSGLGMNHYQREAAAKVLDRHEILDVTSLPNALSLGFMVISRLAGDYGFQVDVSGTSAFGGVRAVLRIPRELLGQGPAATEEESVQQRAAASPVAAAAAVPAAVPAPAAEPAAADPLSGPATGPVPDQPAAGPAAGPPLPRRRRKAPEGAADPAPETASVPVEDPDTVARGLAGLSRAISESEEGNHEGEPPRA
ncbi:histidine kinase [Streptomyces sp. NPDC048845]|uniref:histidine kinase n=1 Tax=Streptomyces sp. NPDC048845 TaxID=3155390 RepID=UPI0034440648